MNRSSSRPVPSRAQQSACSNCRVMSADGRPGLIGCSGGDVLSAGVESAGLGHLISDLALGAQLPGQRGDAKDDETEGGSVGLPVGRLGVPTTGRRPNVLGVPGIGERLDGKSRAQMGAGDVVVGLRDSRTATLGNISSSMGEYGRACSPS
jgi:hypothetical protein